MAEKVQYFEEGTTRLIKWIVESNQRADDFFAMPDVKEGETIREYLGRNAYRQEIFREVIHTLIEIEKNRVTKLICQIE